MAESPAPPIPPAAGCAASLDVAGAVGVVMFPLTADAVECAALERLLSAEERARAGRFAAPVRPGFIIGRGRLRRLLAAVVGDDPAALDIEADPRGKPWLAGKHAGRLHFNVSHSRGACLVGLSRRHPLGVDLELRAADHTPEWAARMAGSILAPAELDRHSRLPEHERPAALLDTWVAKEAVLKGEGVGIGDGVRHLIVPATLPLLRLVPGAAPQPVQLAAVSGQTAFGVCLLDAPEGCLAGGHAAVACPVGAGPIRLAVVP